MSANRNPRGDHAPPTTGINTPPTATQTPPGAQNLNQQ